MVNSPEPGCGAGLCHNSRASDKRLDAPLHEKQDIYVHSNELVLHHGANVCLHDDHWVTYGTRRHQGDQFRKRHGHLFLGFRHHWWHTVLPGAYMLSRVPDDECLYYSNQLDSMSSILHVCRRSS